MPKRRICGVRRPEGKSRPTSLAKKGRKAGEHCPKEERGGKTASRAEQGSSVEKKKKAHRHPQGEPPTAAGTEKRKGGKKRDKVLQLTSSKTVH